MSVNKFVSGGIEQVHITQLTNIFPRFSVDVKTLCWWCL